MHVCVAYFKGDVRHTCMALGGDLAQTAEAAGASHSQHTPPASGCKHVLDDGWCSVSAISNVWMLVFCICRHAVLITYVVHLSWGWRSCVRARPSLNIYTAYYIDCQKYCSSIIHAYHAQPVISQPGQPSDCHFSKLRKRNVKYRWVSVLSFE